MRIGTLGKTEILLDPFTLVVAAGAFVLGRGNEFLFALLALLLHEGSHCLMARAFGCRVESMTLLPFGGMARIAHGGLSPYGEFCIAAAGPAVSFVLGGFTAALAYFFPLTMTSLDWFLTYNLILALVNLIPALPLDGGRMLRCLLSKPLGENRATRLACVLGILSGLGLCLGWYFLREGEQLSFTVPVMGVFLLMTAVLELLRGPDRQLSAFVKLRRNLRAGSGVAVNTVAARASMSAGEAMRILKTNRYNVLRVVDGAMRTLGEVDEARLILAIADRGIQTPLGELLS